MSTTMEFEDNMLLEPPPDFFITESPNDGEAGTYACPFEGCDGIVCDSIDDCYAHCKEWHASPYSCVECGASFAACTALSRHIKASGHQRWVCQNDQCELKGIEFDSHLSYHAHILGSDAHGETKDLACLENGCGETDGDNESDVYMTDGMSVEEFICLEACCTGYLRRLSTSRMFDAHVNSSGHAAAAERGESLRQQGLSPAELETKQKAMRELRCDVKGCSFFGRRLSAAQSYANHIRTMAHLHPRDDTDSDQLSEASDDESAEPRAKPSCDVLECPQYKRQFSRSVMYQRHAKSGPHLRAARMSLVSPTKRKPLRTSPRSRKKPFYIKMDPDDDEDQTAWSAATTPLFTTPKRNPHVTPPTTYGTPYTPRSSPRSTAREAYLERRNRELEEELRRLHAQLDLMSRQA